MNLDDIRDLDAGKLDELLKVRCGQCGKRLGVVLDGRDGPLWRSTAAPVPGSAFSAVGRGSGLSALHRSGADLVTVCRHHGRATVTADAVLDAIAAGRTTLTTA